MFFEQIREQIPFLNNNKTHLSRKKESERITLDQTNQLISEKKYKKALKVIDTAINNGISTNQILFKKAFLLSQTKKHEEANKIWQRLSQLKNKPKLATSAKQLLETSKKNELKRVKTTKLLINKLHAIAEKYQQKLNHLPSPEDWSPTINLIPLICNEASISRSSELPNLSLELIDQALREGLESPSLIHDKALSLSMMGQHSAAVKLLDELNQSVKNPEIKIQIENCKKSIHTNTNHHDSRKSHFLIKQAKLATTGKAIESCLIPADLGSQTDPEIKSLVFKQATICLNKDPETCLFLLDSILAYYPSDNASQQLRGEALAALKRDDEAIQGWKKLAQSGINKTAQKASRSISKVITQRALNTNSSNSPEKALSLYITEHLKIDLHPIYNNALKAILQQLDSSDLDFSDPEIEQQQLQLVFNTLVIEHLEAQLIEQGRLNIRTTTQKPGAISKTARKVD